MKKLLILILALCVAVCSAALADTEITVQGTGVIRTAPDIAVISLGVEESGEDVAAIQSQLNARINAIIAALTGEAGGIAEEDVQTGNYSIYRRYYDDYGNPTKDYVASCMLNVTVRDIEKAGGVIDAAFAAGANTLGNVSFSVDDDGTLADRALELAVEDGMHRAQVIAGAAGVQLPACPSRVSEGAEVSYVTFNSMARSEDVASGKTATKLMGGSVEISATVTVTYDVDD
ncbi:MAG: SIMPL domain-containing protein [Clostridia bacterium]|nr:SIMPL domain-containing protein [Clostridia bacterium]